VRDDEIDLWDDAKIQAGDVWRSEINSRLFSIDTAILLISADFLASDFIHDHELPPILNAWRDRGVRIYWVLLSPCDLSRYQSLRLIQAVNPGLKPLSEMTRNQRERVWSALVASITENLKMSRKGALPDEGPGVVSDLVVKDQVAALKKAVAQIYRARNLSRSLANDLIGSAKAAGSLLDLRELLADLTDLLTEERAILPDTVFRIIHALKYNFFDFVASYEALCSGPEAGTSSKESRISQVSEQYQRLDKGYGELLRAIQHRLGTGD
jgi:hypothetical protein